MGTWKGDSNPGGPGGRTRKIQTGGGKKKGCCPMVAAVNSVRGGRFRLAARYGRMSVRLIAGRFSLDDWRDRMKRKIALFLAAFAVMLGGSLAATSPAVADGPAGYLTFWDGCNGGSNPTAGECGGAWALTAAGGIGVCHALPNGANDRPSAFANNTGHNFRVWTNAGCASGGGNSAILYNGTATGQIDDPFNNKISSQERIS